MDKHDTKIKVLYVIPGFNIGGMETLCFNLFDSLDKNIFECHFASTNYKSHDYYEDKIIKLGGTIDKCDKDKYANKFKRISLYKRFIYNICKKYSIDVVHIHACSPLAYISSKACKKAGVKTVILHSHASDTDTEKALSKMFTKKSVKWSDYHFACGEKAGEWMFGKHFSSLPGSYIINNGFDVQKYAYNLINRNHFRDELGIHNDEFVVGMVSRLHPVKNHLFILSIMPELIRLNNHLKLVIIGDGEMRQEIEKTISELKLNNNVILMGERSDIAEILSSFDCYVMPSFNEGLPTSAIEAQANGLPCIISTGVDHHCNVTGLVNFASIKDKQEWINAILAVQSQAKSDRLSYVQNVVNANYDIKKISDFLSALYQL
jgi:glycosyltransferase involved in cell wall biosynthesis